MLENIPKILVTGIISTVFAIISIAVIIGIGIVIRCLIKSGKSGNSLRVKCSIISSLCILIAAVSWFTNLGWLRFFTVFFPPVHTLILFFVIYYSSKYCTDSNKLKKYIVFSWITYVLGYILLPDAGDVGEMYMFFGLLHSDAWAVPCFVLAEFALFSNLILLVLQIIEAIKIKRALSAPRQVNTNNEETGQSE